MRRFPRWVTWCGIPGATTLANLGMAVSYQPRRGMSTRYFVWRPQNSPMVHVIGLGQG